MESKSKTIKKTDDSAKKLLYEIFHDKTIKINDIDSYYLINGKYVFLEFTKLSELRPVEIIERLDFDYFQNEIPNIIKFSIKADAILYVIFFEEAKEQFLVVKVILENKEIKYKLVNYDEFKKWFQNLNNKALQ